MKLQVSHSARSCACDAGNRGTPNAPKPPWNLGLLAQSAYAIFQGGRESGRGRKRVTRGKERKEVNLVGKGKGGGKGGGKGKGGNYPSTTGKPSGKGRGNKPR